MVHVFRRSVFLTVAAFSAAAFLTARNTMAADPATTAATTPAASEATAAGFTGNKTLWHGFDRYDYFLDENTLAIRPADDKPQGQRRCIVVVPKEAAPGNPWSWRGVYWDHEPQTEIELLKRGFHICYITADANLKPDKKWDAWYSFLTEKHGLAKKAAFVGMSRGGEYSYIWATKHPDKVACIYGDNPGGNADNVSLLEPLAQHDVPILHICGSVDPILQKYSSTIENIYHQFGGRISVITKEDAGHHPHSLRDPKPIADFIEQSAKATLTPAPVFPDFAGKGATRYAFYSLETFYKELPSEHTFVTERGPLFNEVFYRYEVWTLGFQVPVNIIAPTKPAAGNPWVFRADHPTREGSIDLALLAKGYHIVVGPTGYNADGPQKDEWDKVYKYLTDKGFSKKPVMEGSGGASGEVFAWAIANPAKVSCIYAENPVLRSHMSKNQPLENLDALAKAKVPLMIVAGGLDPALDTNTRVLEKRYKDLSGKITVIVSEGQGHFPLVPKDPKPVVDFIASSQEEAKP